MSYPGGPTYVCDYCECICEEAGYYISLYPVQSEVDKNM